MAHLLSPIKYCGFTKVIVSGLELQPKLLKWVFQKYTFKSSVVWHPDSVKRSLKKVLLICNPNSALHSLWWWLHSTPPPPYLNIVCTVYNKSVHALMDKIINRSDFVCCFELCRIYCVQLWVYNRPEFVCCYPFFFHASTLYVNHNLFPVMMEQVRIYLPLPECETVYIN